MPSCVSQPCAVVPCGRVHDPGVVDQDVQRARQAAVNASTEREVGEVEVGDGDVVATAGAGDVGGDALAGGGVAHGEGDLRAGVGQGPRGLDADARRGAGDDGPAAGQVDALDHLEGGGRVVEGAGDRHVAMP